MSEARHADDLDRDLDLVLDAVRAAGRAILEVFGTDPRVRHKGPDQPVTEADLRADAILRDRLTAARPSYGWLSEETPDGVDRLERDRVWIVDPLDGTRSFIRGHPEFAVSAALAEAGAAVLGVVHNPASGEVFWAMEGAGSFRAEGWAGGRSGARRLRLEDSGSRESGLLASRSEIGRGEFGPFEGGWPIRPLGSTAYKLAAVAAGAGAGYLSRGPKSEWDVAAGAVVVAEAGGVVTDMDGARLAFNRRDPYVHGVVAAAPGLHGELLREAKGLPSDRLRRRPGPGTPPDR